MGLTLGLLACVLVLLPGLAVLAAFNYRTQRGGARRPELPLTAISALVIAVMFSIIVHSAAFMLAELTISFAVAVHACGSAWKKDPVSGVIGAQKGPLISVV